VSISAITVRIAVPFDRFPVAMFAPMFETVLAHVFEKKPVSEHVIDS
jgi:hypothetical protein